jgi:hypothetical protein
VNSRWGLSFACDTKQIALYGVRVRGKPYTFKTLEEFTMAATASPTLNNNTKVTPTAPEVTDLVQKTRQGLVSTVQQGQRMSVDAAQNWVQALSVFPIQDFTKIPGTPSFVNLEAITKLYFDIAADLLQAQREYILELLNLFAPEKSV